MAVRTLKYTSLTMPLDRKLRKLIVHSSYFGPVHYISFSKDDELFASGSEDSTLRLWQTTVGKPYGLWKHLNGDEKN